MADRFTEYARALLQRNQYMSLSTVSADGMPWNSPLYYTYSDDATLYWISTPQSQHSTNVEANGRTFISIFDSAPMWGIGQAVYLTAEASVIADEDEIAAATKLWLGRAKIDAGTIASIDEGVRRMYKAVPTKAWINDGIFNNQGELVGDKRADLPLDTLCNLVNW